MKKILITILAIGFYTSCSDLTELDKNPKAATQVPPASLFANAQKNLIDFIASPSVNINIYRMLVQHWTETTYIDESNYDLSTRNIPQNVWHILYRDVLKDLSEARRLIEEDEFLLDAVKSNQLALCDIMEVYAWSLLVDNFGDIPYSQALDFANARPAYDDAESIYDDLVSRLNQDLAALTDSETFGSSDLIYGGDVDAWKKFANSLKLKLGMRLSDVNSATAKTIVESAAAGTFASSSDNAMFAYLDAPPNTNPVWVNLVQSGRKDFVAANTLVDKMQALNDPRVPFYFTTDGSGSAYSGGIYGSSNNFASYSKPADRITEPAFEAFFMTYAEVEFFKAEAIERGYSVGGTAAGHYDNAITASMEYWGVDAADIATYLARADVNYATAPGTYKQKIGTQKWIALYESGFESWCEWRRLDSPTLAAPPDAVSVIPLRYTYPVSEQNLNSANFEAASSAIGGDAVATKLFWDMN